MRSLLRSVSRLQPQVAYATATGGVAVLRAAATPPLTLASFGCGSFRAFCCRVAAPAPLLSAGPAAALAAMRGGGSSTKSNCQDTDDGLELTGQGKTVGDVCAMIVAGNYQSFCAMMADDDFNAMDMCCTCGGGSSAGSEEGGSASPEAPAKVSSLLLYHS